VTLKGDVEATDDTTEVLREHVARKIGKLARPTTIIFTPDLPKTRSGKIMRRLLRDVAENRQMGDVTTLQDSSVMDLISQGLRSGKGDED
jgi:acetyl-CoA synthetase